MFGRMMTDTGDEHEACRRLLAAWDLGQVTHIQRELCGATNRVYRVQASSGESFLRIYRRADPRIAEREHALIAHARRRGVPTVAVLPARTGGSVVQVEGHVCALYEAATGTQLPNGGLGSCDATAAAACLGHLHRALQPLPDAGYLRWQIAWDGPEWIERLSVVELALSREGLQDDTDRWALERLRAQRQWLGHPDCEHAYEPHSPPQVVHGDYQAMNLFFREGSVSAVIDWDQAAFMPRGFEVARACSFLFRLEPELTGEFLRAYHAANPLADAELEDGVRAWACFADHHVWPLEEAYLHGNRAARRFIPHAPFRPSREAWAVLGF
jgi:homoserine kinase type II